MSTNRQKCIGGCGREVLKELGGECRKCRRKRLHAGAKRLYKIRHSEAVEKRQSKKKEKK